MTDFLSDIISAPFIKPSKMEEVEEELTQTYEYSSVMICPKCEIEMIMDTSQNAYVCNLCGQLKSFHDEDYDAQYNKKGVNIVMTVSGPDKSKSTGLVLSTTSDYSDNQFKNTESHIKKLLSAYNTDADIAIIKKVIDTYTDIQKNRKIYRGKPRDGFIVALFCEYCRLHGILREHDSVLKTINKPELQSKHCSSGLKKIEECKSNGELVLRETGVEAISSVDIKLKEYFKQLNIPYDLIVWNGKKVVNKIIIEKPENTTEKPENTVDRPNYHAFIVKLIEFCKKYNISPASQLNSKCSGCMLFIIQHPSLKHIKINDVVAQTGVSRNTSESFYKTVKSTLADPRIPNTIRTLKHLFESYLLQI